MTVPYWHCTSNTHGWSMPKRQVPTLPLTSSSPAASRRRQQHWWLHACAGKMLNGSMQAKCSARLWVMSGPPPERQSTGDLGCAALEVDGARTGEASGRLYTVAASHRGT